MTEVQKELAIYCLLVLGLCAVFGLVVFGLITIVRSL